MILILSYMHCITKALQPITGKLQKQHAGYAKPKVTSCHHFWSNSLAEVSIIQLGHPVELVETVPWWRPSDGWGLGRVMQSISCKPINLMAKGCNKPGASTKASRLSHQPSPSFTLCHGGQTGSWTGKNWTRLGESSALQENTMVMPDEVHRSYAEWGHLTTSKQRRNFEKPARRATHTHSQMVVVTESRDLVLLYSDQFHWRAQGQEGSDPSYYIYIYICIHICIYKIMYFTQKYVYILRYIDR